MEVKVKGKEPTPFLNHPGELLSVEVKKCGYCNQTILIEKYENGSRETGHTKKCALYW